MTRFRSLLPFIVLTLVGTQACKPSVRAGLITPQIQATEGSREFNAPYAAVFASCQSGLVSMGYEIAEYNEDSGMIKTNRVHVKSAAQSNYSGTSATAVSFYRMYVLRLTRTGDDRTRVVAEPRMFKGSSNISNQPIWAIEGTQGESSLWNQLFSEIQDAIDMGVSAVKHEPGPGPLHGGDDAGGT